MAPAELVAKLNRVTGERFAHIAASPVPVLLPFDTAAFLGDRVAAAGTPDAGSGTTNAPNYLFGFNAVPFFYPGPGGYDAVVLARAQERLAMVLGGGEDLEHPRRLALDGIGDFALLHRPPLIAGMAMERKVGARGLRMILEDLMLDLMYQVPNQKKVREVTITREVVLAKDKPITLIEKAG